MTPRKELHNMHGQRERMHEVYDMPALPGDDPWACVTDVPCPVEGCGQTVVWYEAGYVPGYRVCMAPLDDERFDHRSLRHRFLAGAAVGSGNVLIRDDCCEDATD